MTKEAASIRTIIFEEFACISCKTLVINPSHIDSVTSKVGNSEITVNKTLNGAHEMRVIKDMIRSGIVA
jgi:hypothetical protein